MIEYFEQMWALALDGQTQGIFFMGSLYFSVMLFYSLLYQIRVARWPGTRGELTDEKLDVFGYAFDPSEKEYKASVSYTYEVDGKQYAGKRLSPWVFITNKNAKTLLNKQLDTIFRHSDGTVTVYYHPDKPEKSYLLKPGLTGKIITVLLALLPILLYGLKYHG